MSTPAPAQTWIYDYGGTSTGSGGGGGITGAPPVTITTFTVTLRSNQQTEVAVYYTLDSSATADNFTGVAVYLEDPDLSSQPAVQLDGSTPLDGTRQTAALWAPVFENNNHSTWNGTTESHGPADVLIGDTRANHSYRLARNVRIYLAAFGPRSNAKLVRANQPNPTPNVLVSLAEPGTQYARGEEYAWLVTNVSATLEEDFNRPDPSYRIEYAYTPPDPNIPTPPGMSPFGGCEIFFTYPDAKNTDPLYAITDSGVFVPQTASNGYLSPAYNPGNGGTFRVYFCSGDNSQPSKVNSLIPGVTPYVELTVTYPPTDGSGNPLPTTPDITGLALSNPRMVWQPDGSMLAEIDATWTNPTSANYAGLEFYVTAINPPDPNYKLPIQLADMGNNLTRATFAVLNWPKSTEQWTIIAVSLDSYGKQNNDPNAPRATSMQAIWTIGPPGPGGTGQENAALVTPLQLPTPTVDQQLSNDGVRMARFTISGWTDPNNNNFGGAKIAMVDEYGVTTYYDAGKATTFTTPWVPAGPAQRIYFYIVSYNPQNQQNTIVPQPGGQTPYTFVDFVPQKGQIIASQIPNNWWDTSEFAWPTYPASGGFQANIIEAGKIAVGSILRVGGAPSSSPFAPSFQGQNGQIAVYSSGSDPGDTSGTPTLRAWMGQQSTQLPDKTFGTVYGGWFAELFVGGAGPPTSPLYVRNGGVVKLGGWDVQAGIPGTNAYPYISVVDKYGQEQGRIGASIAANWFGGRMVPVGDIADIGGAWFNQIAIGGQDLAHWQILAPGDKTLRIRQINKLEIDYTSNIAPAPPYNAPYQLLLGTDTAYTAIGQNKFPGITLMRTNTTNNTHGITIINRGIILTADDPNVSQTQRIALVTFNGDSAGYDGTPFWGELVMFSPTTGNQNVTFDSGNKVGGSLVGAPSLTMLDDHGNLHFQVRSSGDLVIGAQMFWGPTASIQLIDASGNYIGPIKTSNFSAASYSINNVGPVINSSGQFVGTSIQTAGWITAGSSIYGTYFAVPDWYGATGEPNTHQVISHDGRWTGQPITGAQTPWTSEINANRNDLVGITDITSADSTYYLHNQPHYSGDHVLEISGPGILIMTSGGGYPRLDLQNNAISLLNASAANVFAVDLNGLVTAQNGIQCSGSTAWILGKQFGINGVAWGAGGPQHPTLKGSFTFTTNDGRTVSVLGGLIIDCK